MYERTCPGYRQALSPAQSAFHLRESVEMGQDVADTLVQPFETERARLQAQSLRCRPRRIQGVGAPRPFVRNAFLLPARHGLLGAGNRKREVLERLCERKTGGAGRGDRREEGALRLVDTCRRQIECATHRLERRIRSAAAKQ